MKQLLLLDMDETVRRPKSGAKFINDPLDQEIIPEAQQAIIRYHEDGWTIFGITNQGGVSAGHKSFEDCLKEQHYTLELCPQLDAIIFCPDFEGEKRIDVFRTGILPTPKDLESLHNSFKGTYRKPNPGMLLYAIAWLGVNKEDCLYVGDRSEDEEAAKNAGVKFRWMTDWY